MKDQYGATRVKLLLKSGNERYIYICLMVHMYIEMYILRNSVDCAYIHIHAKTAKLWKYDAL